MVHIFWKNVTELVTLLIISAPKSNVFTVSVGNLPPGKEVLVCIQYVIELEFENGKVKPVAKLLINFS
jgi:hypothetical protein